MDDERRMRDCLERFRAPDLMPTDVAMRLFFAGDRSMAAKAGRHIDHARIKERLTKTELWLYVSATQFLLERRIEGMPHHG